MEQQISFIGAGSMAESLINGWLNAKHLNASQIVVTNRANNQRLADLQKYYGIQATRDGEKLISPKAMVILACKPKDWSQAIEPYLPYLTEETPIISVMAGVSTETIEKTLNKPRIQVIRTMPNTSATVGASMTGICYGSSVNDDIKNKVNSLFLGVGETAIVDEEKMDAMTALIGTGPAYIYYLMEAMEMAAEKMGIERPLAKKLVSQTLLGASTRVQHGNEGPAELYEQIMSPGGTTEAGFKVLQNREVQDAIISCILRAWERSVELGNSDANSSITTPFPNSSHR